MCLAQDCGSEAVFVPCKATMGHNIRGASQPWRKLTKGLISFLGNDQGLSPPWADAECRVQRLPHPDWKSLSFPPILLNIKCLKKKKNLHHLSIILCCFSSMQVAALDGTAERVGDAPGCRVQKHDLHQETWDGSAPHLRGSPAVTSKNYLSWMELWPEVRNLLDPWASPRLLLPWRFGLCLGKESAAEDTNNGIRIFLYNTCPETAYHLFSFHLPSTQCSPNFSLGKYLQQGFNVFSFLRITFFLLAKGGKMELPFLRVRDF